MLLNATDFSKWVGVKPPAITSSKKLVREKSGYYDTKHPVNKEYAARHGVKRQPAKKHGFIDAVEAADKKVAENRATRQPGEKKKGGRPVKGTQSGERNLLEIEQLQLKNEQLQLKLDDAREELIDRDLVRRVFGELFQIDVNEFIPLAANLAPQGAGLCGIEDPAIVTKMTIMWEKELYKMLKHRLSIMNKLLKKIGAEKIEEAK